jgi:hypothetical protein
MAAYGGMMGGDGRRRYGLGSFLKKTARKLIPNEIAKVAEVAAPFVAPFNPLAAGLMSGIGGFDRTGSIGSSLKSGLMNYGLGQGARYLGGAGFQGAPEMLGGSGLGGTYGFSSPLGTDTGIGKFLADRKPAGINIDKGRGSEIDKLYRSGSGNIVDEVALTGNEGIISSPKASTFLAKEKEKFSLLDIPSKVKKALEAAGLGNNLMTGLLVGGLGAGALMDNMEPEEIQELQRGEGLDIEGIRTEVLTAMKDPTGEALKAIRIKYPFLGNRDTKDVSGLAYGGRIGFENGGS